MIPIQRLRIATPYGVAESINWLIKNAMGLSKKNAGIVKELPNTSILNENTRFECKLAFIGDIMTAENSSVKISDGMKEFLSDADYLVGNFEGVITKERKAIQPFAFDQRHDENIIEMLTDLFEPRKTYLSLSNNHAGDFGEEEFLKSAKMLETRNFNVFGWRKKPFFDINDSIRLISGTMWSNRNCNFISRLENAKNHIKQGAFNFFYPHFGYELELYPRPGIVKMARGLIREFDAIIGHHPHCPQPVTTEEFSGINKLLAYSLGDFCGVLTTKKYQYGILVKAELARDEKKRMLIGKVEWRLTKCSSLGDGNFIVSLSDDRI